MHSLKTFKNRTYWPKKKLQLCYYLRTKRIDANATENYTVKILVFRFCKNWFMSAVVIKTGYKPHSEWHLVTLVCIKNIYSLTLGNKKSLSTRCNNQLLISLILFFFLPNCIICFWKEPFIIIMVYRKSQCCEWN